MSALSIPFADLLNIKIVSNNANNIVGTLQVSEKLCTTGARIHGGAIMAFADTLGAIGAFQSRPDGTAGTTTLESKTNFIGGAKLGSTITGETTPVHVGRRTSVWQTRITNDDGKLVAVVTQTQMVL